LLGDYNLNCFDYDQNERVRNFYDLIYEQCAIPIINKPTRIAKTSATLIDNILTNDISNNSLKKGIIRNDMSDHFPIFFSINTSKNKPLQENIKIKKRDFNDTNIASFKEQLSFINWRHIDFNKDVNEIYDTFIKTFDDIYCSNFPLKEFSVKSKDLHSPWITKGIKKSSKTKQKLYIRYLKHKTTENHNFYKTYCRKFEKLRKKAKKDYYSSLLNKHKNNSRKIWQVMKKIAGKEKTKSNVLPKTIKIKDKNLYNEEEIAYEFNTFFTSVGSELAKKFLLLIRNLKST